MMVGAWWAWPLALALYLVFRAWYDNWRGPLSQAEIEAFLAETAKSKLGETTERAVIRAFLEADDGKEFIMSNLVRVHPHEVPHPVTGAPTTLAAANAFFTMRYDAATSAWYRVS